ncbi:MAG: hypothetical protein ABIV21_05375 [Pyrinomonadaceae bacterium]
MFKKYLTMFLMFAVLGIMIPMMASTTNAQTRRYYNSRTHRWVYYKKPGFYRRHRKAVNIGAGAGVGALAGGLIGGRKGVAIGGLAGAGGGYLVTKKQRSKNHVRYYTRNGRRIYVRN